MGDFPSEMSLNYEGAQAKAESAKKVTTYNQALQIVINSHNFKGEVKGLTKKTDTLYVNSDNITGVSLSPGGNVGHEGEAWIPVTGYSSDEGWLIFNDRKAFSISLGYVGLNVTNTGQGYWVEYDTGKLFRWDAGRANEVK